MEHLKEGNMWILWGMYLSGAGKSLTDGDPNPIHRDRIIWLSVRCPLHPMRGILIVENANSVDSQWHEEINPKYVPNTVQNKERKAWAGDPKRSAPNLVTNYLASIIVFFITIILLYDHLRFILKNFRSMNAEDFYRLQTISQKISCTLPNWNLFSERSGWLT